MNDSTPVPESPPAVTSRPAAHQARPPLERPYPVRHGRGRRRRGAPAPPEPGNPGRTAKACRAPRRRNPVTRTDRKPTHSRAPRRTRTRGSTRPGHTHADSPLTCAFRSWREGGGGVYALEGAHGLLPRVPGTTTVTCEYVQARPTADWRPLAGAGDQGWLFRCAGDRGGCACGERVDAVAEDAGG